MSFTQQSIPNLFVPENTGTQLPTRQLINKLNSEIIQRNSEIHRLQQENKLMLKALTDVQKKIKNNKG